MKLSKEQQLFRELTDKFNEELYILVDKDINKLLLLQKNDRDTLLVELSKIMMHYDTTDNILNLSSIDKLKITNKLNKIIDDTIKEEVKLETSRLTDVLMKNGLDKYYTNSYILSLGLIFTIKKVDENVLERIIKKTINGKNYSDRIWDNKNKVAKLLRGEVKKFVNGETNLNKIEKLIKNIFNSNAYNTRRLAQTEIARVMEGVNDAWQWEHDIKWVLYSATLDMKTCNDCGQYDGLVFDIDKKPVELPKHPMCRCTYIALPHKGYRPRTRRDNENKHSVNWTTYNDWKKENNL